LSARAGIVVTGTELLTGQVRDSNSPWLAQQLADLGIELAHIVTCGDRPGDLKAALMFMRDEKVDLVVTSGGLGPTADDLTAQVVADFAGRDMVLDEALERRIAEIIAGFARRWKLDEEALRAANRKQAMVPEGAVALSPIGTAPGLVVPADGQVVVVLPGPPRELQGGWEQAVETEPFATAVSGRIQYRRRMLRLFGIPESEIAATLRTAEQDIGIDGLEITTCLRRGEIEVTIRNEPGDEPRASALEGFIATRHEATLFSRDGAKIDDQVAELLRGRRLAIGESCTAGLLAARLTERPGSSEYFAGGVVAYSNESKTELLGVPAELIERHGAVSEEVAEAMADGAMERFSADVAIGLTGIAGPDGGTDDKPVGRVCFCAHANAHGERQAVRIVRSVDLPGSRADVRDRATTVALHLLRRALLGEQAPEWGRRDQ
jgi:competence/damage-inducible protein CinA-like protein